MGDRGHLLWRAALLTRGREARCSALWMKKGHPPSGKRGQGVHASPRRALPLLLLGVKLGFLGLHAVNELPECLVGLLVGYASDKASVVSDLLVELGTLNHTWPFPKLARTCLRLANPSATQLFIEADPTNEKSAREVGWDRQPGRQVFFRPKLAGSCWRAFAMRLKRRDLARTVPELHRVSVYNSLSRAFALSSSPQVRSMRSIMWPSASSRYAL